MDYVTQKIRKKTFVPIFFMDLHNLLRLHKCIHISLYLTNSLKTFRNLECLQNSTMHGIKWFQAVGF